PARRPVRSRSRGVVRFGRPGGPHRVLEARSGARADAGRVPGGAYGGRPDSDPGTGETGSTVVLWRRRSLPPGGRAPAGPRLVWGFRATRERRRLGAVSSDQDRGGRRAASRPDREANRRGDLPGPGSADGAGAGGGCREYGRPF